MFVCEPAHPETVLISLLYNQPVIQWGGRSLWLHQAKPYINPRPSRSRALGRHCGVVWRP